MDKICFIIFGFILIIYGVALSVISENIKDLEHTIYNRFGFLNNKIDRIENTQKYNKNFKEITPMKKFKVCYVNGKERLLESENIVMLMKVLSNEKNSDTIIGITEQIYGDIFWNKLTK